MIRSILVISAVITGVFIGMSAGNIVLISRLSTPNVPKTS